tara:strand:- start:357 stop:2381 length:2025 start_codon:yes stop_codon:yes gene_type:complete
MASELLQILGASGVKDSTDDDFASVTGLYHFDGTNGGVNGFAKTAGSVSPTFTNNDAAQGSVNPFSRPDGYWSVLFPGNTAGYLSNTNNMTAVGNGDFTIEFWAMRTDTNNGGFFQYTASPLDVKSGALGLGIYNDEYYLYYGTSGALAARAVTSSGIPGRGTWFHVAYVRSSGTITIYTDGTAVTTQASTTNYTDVSFTLGGYYSSSFLFGGYISNFRVVKGTAVYTSNFTPPTTPLTGISGTILLTAQSPRFVDNSTESEDLTVQGTSTLPPKIQTFSPFSPPDAYDVTTHGGSAYFDGAAVITSSVAIPMTGEFSISGWIYPEAVGSYSGILGTSTSGTYTANMNYTLAMHNGNLDIFQSTGSTFHQNTIGTPDLYSWNHFAISKDSSKLYGYLNGVKNLETTNITNVAANGLVIGRFYTELSNYYYTGYLSDLRLVDGSALYTASSVTVPTTLSTDVTNTDLLMHFEHASIFDSSAFADVEITNNAQLSTAQQKFGTASLLLDGTNDNLTIENIPVFGDFTVEFWMRRTGSFPSYGAILSSANYYVSGNTNNWIMRTEGASSLGLAFYSNGQTGLTYKIWTVSTMSVDTWYHVAFCRSGSDIRAFLDGTESSSGTLSLSTPFTDHFTNGLIVGEGTANTDYAGYIDDLRITNSARYTSSFTAPTKEFPNK